MGRRGGWEKREDFRMRKIEVEEESKKRRIGGIGWEGEKYGKKRRMGEWEDWRMRKIGGEEGYLRKRRKAGSGG